MVDHHSVGLFMCLLPWKLMLSHCAAVLIVGGRTLMIECEMCPHRLLCSNTWSLAGGSSGRVWNLLDGWPNWKKCLLKGRPYGLYSLAPVPF